MTAEQPNTRRGVRLLFVPGTPVGQGDKQIGTARDGRRFVREDKANEIRAFRRDFGKVWLTMRPHGWQPLDGPLYAEVIFAVARTPTAAKRGDVLPAGKPDTDKLQRALGDALTEAKVIRDDARIVEWSARKRFAGIGRNVPAVPGVLLVQLRPIRPDEV